MTSSEKADTAAWLYRYIARRAGSPGLTADIKQRLNRLMDIADSLMLSAFEEKGLERYGAAMDDSLHIQADS